jgi:hypothetical protein
VGVPLVADRNLTFHTIPLSLVVVDVALGCLAKEFLRWTRDGVNTHIFNPSSLPLAVASALLLITNASQTTWGFEVATTQFYQPQIPRRGACPP